MQISSYKFIILKREMYLIPLDQIIYFNISYISATDLSAIVLLSFAYHPAYSNILYLFYGSTYQPISGQTYGSFHLLVRDTDTSSFIQNTTIAQQFHCIIACEIKATANLFLIQSQDLIGVYPLSSNYSVVASPIHQSSKTSLNQISDLTRLADISNNKYVVIDGGGTGCTFGQYSGSRVLSTYSYSMSFNANDALFVGLSSESDQMYFVVNSSQVSFIFYNCVSCIFSGSVPVSTTVFNSSNTFHVATNISTSSVFRLYQGFTITDSNATFTNARVYWAFTGGNSRRFLINNTNYEQIEINSGITESYSTANSDYFITFGTDYTINFRTFEFIPTDDEYTNYYYSGYDYTSMVIRKARMSNDSAIFAAQSSSYGWMIQQYEVVENCSYYNASINSYSTLFCDCYQYYTDNKCVYLLSTSSETNSSFPIAAVIAVVAGLVFVGISIVIIKKNYKKCTKGRRRIPYKYNPAELMSFQI